MASSNTFCDETEGKWIPAPIVQLNDSQVTVSVYCEEGGQAVGVRYEWHTSPCDFKMCAIYDADKNGEEGLPAPPFMSLIEPSEI